MYVKKKKRTITEIKLEIIDFLSEHKFERVSKLMMKINLSYSQVEKLVDEGFLVKEKIGRQKVVVSLYGTK